MPPCLTVYKPLSSFLSTEANKFTRSVDFTGLYTVRPPGEQLSHHAFTVTAPLGADARLSVATHAIQSIVVNFYGEGDVTRPLASIDVSYVPKDGSQADSLRLTHHSQELDHDGVRRHG